MGNKWFSAEKMSKGISLFGLCSCVSLLLFVFASFAGAQVVECSCTSCHGNPPTEDTRGGPNGLVGIGLGLGTSSGAHDHLARLQIKTCDGCHFKGMPDTPIPDLKLQIGFSINGGNGAGMIYDGMPSFIDPKWTYEATNGTTVTQNGTMKCSNVYCHGGGTGGTNNKGGVSKSAYLNSFSDPRAIAASSSPAWYDKTPILCNYCHGRGTTDGRPSYQSGSPKANGHVYPHSGAKCHLCHYATTHDDASIYDVSRHHNGTYDVVPDPTVTFTYTFDPGGGKCTNVSCHGGDPYIGYWGSPIIGSTGINTSVNYVLGPACYQISGTVSQIIGQRASNPPYIYDWDWGDGTTTSGTSATLPITASHTYSQAGTYYSVFNFRDGNYVSGNSSLTPIILKSTNVPPVTGSSAASNGWVVTLTDLSYDPDYNSCGHSGPGTIYIDWNDGTTTKQAISLTDKPSNVAFQHTYNFLGTNPKTFYLVHSIQDNAGATISETSTIPVTVTPPMYTVSGKITHSGPGYPAGSSFSGVDVQVYNLAGSYITDATSKTDGTYTITGIPAGSGYNIVPVRGGFTFTPVSATITQSTTGVNFVGTP